MEAIDHFAALRYVRDLARERVALREADIRDLHRLVVQRSAPEIAGRYADQARFVVTDSGRQSFPSADKVPALMGDFAQWLASALATPETAFAAHRRLLRGGYPPVAVRPQDRPSYIGGVTGFGRKWR